MENSFFGRYNRSFNFMKFIIYKIIIYKRKTKCRLNTIEEVRFRTLHVDHVSSFKTNHKGNKYQLVIINAFIKFTVIKNHDSMVEGTILNMIYLFGISTRIISDRGTAFASRTFRTFYVMYGIKQGWATFFYNGPATNLKMLCGPHIRNLW